ncbi:hypothetical protein Tco_0719022 [Tanacetum coccineum]
MMGQMQKTLQERPYGVLPSNTVPNRREELKAITTWSGIVLAEHSIPLPPLYSSSKEVERDPETITDQVLLESTTRVPPPVVQPSPSSRTTEIPLSPSSSPSELPKRNPHQPPIPYPLRMNKEKLQDKSDIQVHKFLQMFKKLHFNISLAEALALMPKYAKKLNGLLFDKEKLLRLANTSLTENCSAVLLKKLLEKLGDPGKFLIPYDFPKLEKCMALADLVDIYGEELILRDGDEKLIFHADSSTKHPHKHDDDFDPEADLREIEYLLNRDSSTDSSPKTDIDIIDPILKRFTDEPALVYSFPPGDDDDDLFDFKSDNEEWKKLLSDEDFSVLLFLPKDKGIRGESSKRLAQKQALLGRQPELSIY